jgi:VCBS repeat-containing protein
MASNDGTLWFALQGDTDEFGKVGPSGTAVPLETYSNSSGVQTTPLDVVVDPTSDLWFGLDEVENYSTGTDGFDLLTGSTATGQLLSTIGTPSQANSADPVNAGVFSINGVAIDDTDHLLFLTPVGPQDSDTGIYEYHYSASGALTDLGFAVEDQPGGLQDPRSVSYDASSRTLYVVDSTPSDQTGSFENATNAILSYSVGSNGALSNPETLTNDNQFLDNMSSNGLIVDVVADDKASGFIYFLTESANQADDTGGTTDQTASPENTIWYISKTAGPGQTAQQLGGLPGNFASTDSAQNPGLTYDPKGNGGAGALYFSDQGTGDVVQVNLASSGQFATSVNTNYFQSEPGHTDGANGDQYETHGLTFVDGPTITLGTTSASYTGDAPAVTLQSGLTLSDPNNTAVTSATVTVAGGYGGDGDVLNVNGATSSVTYGGQTFSLSYAGAGSSSETLTITGSASAFTYQALLNEVQFSTTSKDPTNGGSDATRTVSIQATDAGGGTGQAAQTETLALSRLNPPTVSGFAGSTREFIQGGSAVVLLAGAPSLTSGANITGADLRITNSRPGDTLGLPGAANNSTVDNGAITVRLSGQEIQFSGSASVGEYETLLSEVTYQDAASGGGSGQHPVRDLQLIVSNAAGDTQPATATVTIDRAPTASVHTVRVAEDANASGSAGDTDPDGDTLTVSAVGGGNVGQPITGAYGVLTLQTNDTYSYSASNAAAIDSAPSGAHPVDDYSYTVTDTDGQSTSETLSFAIDRAPTAPADSDSSANSVTEGAAEGTAVGVTASSSDPDGDTVSYSLTADSSNGGLQIDPTTGVVSVADGADLQFDVAGHAYSVTVQASDGALTSSQTFDVAVQDVTPTISGTSGAQTVANGVEVQPFSGVMIGDAGSTTQPETVSVTPSDPTGGGFSAASLQASGFTADPDTSGQYDFTGTAAQDTSAIEQLVFDPTPATPADPRTTSFLIEVGDGTSSAQDDSTSVTVPCYCPGTLILTDRGEVAVENLAVGDRLVTGSGEAKPLKWIGRRAYQGQFIAGNRRLLPVCVKAGAMSDGLPRRDLWVSPLHAMVVDGALVPAGALVNGVSVVQASEVDEVRYIHLELDQHSVIYAEGAASESFVDDDSRAMFQNAHTFPELYPDARPTSAVYCLPRVEDGEELERLRALVNAHAGLSRASAALPALLGYLDRAADGLVEGWAQVDGHPEAPVCLEIWIAGKLATTVLANRYRKDLQEAGLGSGRHGFSMALKVAPGDAVEVRRALDGAVLGWSDARVAA